MRDANKSGKRRKIAPQPRPNRLGKSSGVHHAPVDDANRAELEHPLVNRFAHLRLAPELSATDVVVVIDLYGEMSERVLLFGRRWFDRRHFSTKSRRGSPNRPYRQHQRQWHSNQSADDFHQRVSLHIMYQVKLFLPNACADHGTQ